MTYVKGPVDYTNEVGTWYRCDPQPPKLRCRLGMHTPTRMRADGGINGARIQRVRCQCGLREWMLYGDATVSLGFVQRGSPDVVSPDADVKQREFNAVIEQLHKEVS